MTSADIYFQHTSAFSWMHMHSLFALKKRKSGQGDCMPVLVNVLMIEFSLVENLCKKKQTKMIVN